MKNILGPSWLPKVGGAILAASMLAATQSNNSTVREVAGYVSAAGAVLLGTARQNNVRSEQAIKPKAGG